MLGHTPLGVVLFVADLLHPGGSLHDAFVIIGASASRTLSRIGAMTFFLITMVAIDVLRGSDMAAQSGISDGGAAITVSMIHIPTWENELRVVEITAPIPVEEWLAQSTGGVLRARDPAVRLADRRRPVRWGARGGRPRRRRGQHVYVRAVPPEAIPLLEGLLPDDQYRRLLARTPGLAGLVRPYERTREQHGAERCRASPRRRVRSPIRVGAARGRR